ncbi:MAG: sugar ABC transporter permease, partial [Caldilineaceae bacterium]|nr:sugar ABC transporter permease [Caldilineaceae bacterium]
MATASPARPRRSAFRRREVIEGYLFASPFIIGFLVFIAFPMIWAFVLMFQRYNLLRPPMFVGLTNVQDMIADPKTWQSMWNTIYYAFVSVPLQLAL